MKISVLMTIFVPTINLVLHVETLVPMSSVPFSLHLLLVNMTSWR